MHAERAELRGTPQDEGVDARMLSALIAGVRRAFPYVAPEAVEPLIEAHAAALFRVCHTASFGVAVQGLMLLFQLMAARHSVSDRFYRCGEGLGTGSRVLMLGACGRPALLPAPVAPAR